MDKKLTIEQSMSTARVFLNIFGFELDEIDTDINDEAVVRIFDKNKNVVGELNIECGKVVIRVSNDSCTLSANYVIPKVSGFNDGGALFLQWASDVKYSVKNTDHIEMHGDITIDCTMDSEFGVRCNCHPTILCDKDSKTFVGVKILRDGKVFSYKSASIEGSEIIDIMPWNDLMGYIIHDIKRGGEVAGKYSYRRYAGVFKSSEHSEMLSTFLMEENDGNVTSHSDNFEKCSKSECSSDLLVQKGMLMQELDPAMFEEIGNLRDLFMVGDVSLFDNLVSVCYDSYTNEEVKALLGVERKPFVYQDGSDNLISAYYGIDKENSFGVTEAQKLFFKTKKETTN